MAAAATNEQNETEKKKKKKKRRQNMPLRENVKSKRSYHEMSYPCCLRYGFIEKGGGTRMKMSLRIR